MQGSGSVLVWGSIVSQCLRAGFGGLVCCFAVRPCFLRFIVISALSHRSMPHQGTLLLLHLWQPLKLALGACAPTGRDTEHQGGSAQLHYGPRCRVGRAEELQGRSVTGWVPCAGDGPLAPLGPIGLMPGGDTGAVLERSGTGHVLRWRWPARK